MEAAVKEEYTLIRGPSFLFRISNRTSILHFLFLFDLHFSVRQLENDVLQDHDLKSSVSLG